MSNQLYLKMKGALSEISADTMPIKQMLYDFIIKFQTDYRGKKLKAISLGLREYLCLKYACQADTSLRWYSDQVKQEFMGVEIFCSPLSGITPLFDQDTFDTWTVYQETCKHLNTDNLN